MLSLMNKFRKNFRCFSSIIVSFILERTLSTFKFNNNSVLLFHTLTACMSSRSTDISVGDSAWNSFFCRTSLAISDGTGLIARVYLLLQWALMTFLRSKWVIRARIISLRRIEIHRLEFTIFIFDTQIITAIIKN